MLTMKKITQLLVLCLALPLPALADGLLAVDNPAKNDQEQRGYAALYVFEANDQIAMRQYGGDWQGAYSPRSGTNIGILSARAETGAQWQGYRVGVLYRAEALVEANRDTSDLVRQYENNSGYDVGRTYSLDYRIKGFEANGARLSKSYQLALASSWQMNVGLGLSYLHGKRIKLETASGQVVTLDAKDLDASARLDQTDSQLNVSDPAKFPVLFRRPTTPSGQGYALDVGMVLHHRASGASIELAVSDLFGRINWKNLPRNVTDYSTANKYYDSDGFAQFNPTATRTSSYQNLTQKLDPKLWLAASYPIGEFELQGATGYTRGYWFPQAAVGYRVNQQWRLKAEYDLRFHTLMLAIQSPWIYLGVRTDNANLDKAKAYGITGGIHLRF